MQKTPSPQSAIKSGSAHRPQAMQRQTPAQDHTVADGLLTPGVSAYDNARSAHPAHPNLLHLQEQWATGLSANLSRPSSPSVSPMIPMSRKPIVSPTPSCACRSRRRLGKDRESEQDRSGTELRGWCDEHPTNHLKKKEKRPLHNQSFSACRWRREKMRKRRLHRSRKLVPVYLFNDFVRSVRRSEEIIYKERKWLRPTLD